MTRVRLTSAEPVQAEGCGNQLLWDVDPAREPQNFVSPSEELLLIFVFVVLQLIILLSLNEPEADVDWDDRGSLEQHPSRKAEEERVLRRWKQVSSVADGMIAQFRDLTTHMSTEECTLSDEQQDEAEDVVEINAEAEKKRNSSDVCQLRTQATVKDV